MTGCSSPSPTSESQGVGASRLDVECTECGASERKYVPRGTVSVEHVCGSGWQLEGKPAARAAV